MTRKMQAAQVEQLPPVRRSWRSRAPAAVCAGEQTGRLDTHENFLMD
ncbi:hypothetical protein [Polaromonas sp. DSR2-3-2]